MDINQPNPLHKEEVASEKRKWLRISNACNNRCIFCLDSDHQDGTFIPLDEVKQEIDHSIKQGYDRLIISGGEASIHPDFIKIIEYTKSQGFKKIQTISNGRMFSKLKFIAQAKQAGLDEITFSIHGHTDELHDRLVSVPGAFKQAVKGIQNARNLGFIVSVDIVLNRINIAHLYDIVRFFIDMGVYEFDLLYLGPFGRAYDEHFYELYFELSDYQSVLHKTLELDKDPRVHIWTNRLPADALSGYEAYIQDPHKLYDEMQGRKDDIKTIIKNNWTLFCYGDRCQYCFIQPMCSHLHQTIAAFHKPDTSFNLKLISPEKTIQLIKNEYFKHWDPFIKRLSIHLSSELLAIVEQEQDTLRNLASNNPALIIELFDVSSGETSIKASIDSSILENALSFISTWSVENPVILHFYHPDNLLKLKNIPFTKRLALYSLSIDFLLNNREAIKNKEFGDLELWLPYYYSLSDCVKQIIDFRAFFDQFFSESENFQLPVLNAPKCLTENGFFQEKLILCDCYFEPDELINLSELVTHYITNSYLIHSRDCKACAEYDNCPGIHINWVRHFGFDYFCKGKDKISRT